MAMTMPEKTAHAFIEGERLTADAAVVRKAAEFHRLRQENHLLRKAVRDQYRFMGPELPAQYHPLLKDVVFGKVAENESD